MIFGTVGFGVVLHVFTIVGQNAPCIRASGCQGKGGGRPKIGWRYFGAVAVP